MIEDALHSYARKKGILLGICRAERIDSYFSGICGKTPFVTRNIERRINPNTVLKGAKSIVAVGVKYEGQDSFVELRSRESSAFCRITKMAPRDYHVRIKAMLKGIAEYLSSIINKEFKYRILVDSGLLVEREYARLAGLGFIGKNRMLISKEIGSFFNIGLLLTDLELIPYSADLDDANSMCGECRRCIDACPAALNGGNYDVEKCISYLTQTKGDISKDMQVLLNGYIYGCDICQNVCPYNDRASDIDLEIKLDAEKLSRMTEEQFLDTFGATSMSWIGYELFKRNVAYSLTLNFLK